MSTAPPVTVPAPVYTREVTPGVSISSNMTPQERFAIVAKAHGVEVAAPKAAPQFHTPANITTFANEERDAAKRAAPPAKPAQAPDPNAVTKFDQEMRATGLQRVESAPPTGVPNEPYMADLMKVYRKTREGYEDMRRSVTTASARTKIEREVTAFQAKWQKEYAYAEAGGNHPNYPGSAPTVAPEQANYNAALQRAIDSQDAKGGVAHTAIGSELTSGYALPPGTYGDLKDLLDGLKIARGRGWSQAQVEKIITDNWA